MNKKHLKNVGPIRYREPPHAHSPDVASGTVARHLRIDVHDDNDNAWQRGLLWPHGMGQLLHTVLSYNGNSTAAMHNISNITVVCPRMTNDHNELPPIKYQCHMTTVGLFALTFREITQAKKYCHSVIITLLHLVSLADTVVM